MIGNEILKAFGYLFISAIVAGAYSISSKSKPDRNGTLFKGLLICAGIALFASLMLGSPSCNDSETDYISSNCNQYADNGYVPTTEQSVANFAYVMTLLYVPVAIGAFNKSKGKEA